MQTNALTSGSEILFHPPGCNPFYVPPLLSNNYHPSNPQNQPTYVKAIALTPEKKRNFHLKDNASYTPLNYSFCNDDEENVDVNVPEKPSDQVKQHWVPQPKKQAPISTTRIPIPKSTLSIHGGYSDTDSHHKSKTSQNLTSNSRAPSRDSRAISVSSISAPVPKMTSTQNSKGKVSPNISMLVKRFRHGKPQPPSARKLSNTSSTPSSDKSKYEWMSTTIPSSQSISAVAESSSLEEINDVFDSSLAELQSQVDQILKQSETPQSLPTPVPTPIFTPEIPSFNPTPTPPMLQPMENISSAKTSHMVPSFVYKPQTPQQVPVAKQPEEPFPPRIPVQDDILQQWRLKRKMEMARATSATSRDQIWSSCHREAPQSCSIRCSDSVNYPAAEKPYTPSCSPRKAEPPHQVLEPRKCTKSVGVSVVPTSCAETQTTPKSSNENSVVSINDFRTDSSVSMHRVTVVDGSTGTHDLSPLSSKVTTRSDPDMFDEGSTHSRSNQRNIKGRVESLKKKANLPHSPTTSVVKQVIGTHLFDAATDVLTPGRTEGSSDVYFDSSISDHSMSTAPTTQTKKVPDDESSSSPHHISSTPLPNSQIPPDPLPNIPSLDAASTTSGSSKKQGSIQSSSEVEDPQDILDSILDNIRNDPGVFPDDPVLTSLRQQRQKYLDELTSIDDQLSRLQ
nr:flocculation protein FLO11 isoform X1 [Ciona intestinalis]|eukprot:XP_026692098.1 flocculation protein FLO11 isoform X1 [Ciona intestinalis]